MFDGSSEEFDHILSSNGAELIPMKMLCNIRLSDIWIPSELLSNRENPVQLHLDKPIPFRRLEKLGPAADSFSIYNESDAVVGYSNSSSGEKWLDSLEEFDHISSCENKEENEASNFKANSSCQEILESPSNSIPDLLDYLCRSDSDCEDPVTETIQNPVTAVSHSVNSLTNSGYQESTLNSLFLHNEPDNLLHELATSNENIKYTKSFVSNENVLSSHQKESVNVSGTVSFTSVVNQSDPNLTSGSDPHALNQGSAKEIIDNSLYFSEPTHSSVLNDEVDDSTNKWATAYEKLRHSEMLRDWEAKELNKSTDVDLDQETSNSENKSTFLGLDHETSNSENISNQVPDFTIPYQRAPENTDTSYKPKSKKEKKTKNKSTKNVPLVNFFLSEREIAEVKMQSFYENLVQEKNSASYVSSKKTNVSPFAFPSFEKSNEEFVGKCKMEEAQKPELTLKMVTNLLKESSNSDTTNDGNIEKRSVECVSNNDQVKIVIENIPLCVDEEMLRSTVQTYGDILRLILRRNGKTLKAELMMILDDPDWLIDCLDGSYPFGEFSGEGLKCYQRN